MIIQQPDTLSLSGNLKKFILSSGSTVSFVLKDGTTTILNATYEPGADGRVMVDVKDIVENRLSFLLSTQNFYEQPNIVKTFTAIIDGATVSFKVIRAGVANLADTPTNWLAQNFLTWQPAQKQVTYYSPEWLTYYATDAATIKLKAYFPDDTEQNITVGSCEVGKAFTANLQYAVVAGLLGQKYPSYFEVWAENAAGNRLTYLQRYLYSEPKSELEQWFLFENSLGGIDTLRAYGDTDFEGAHEHKIASIDGSSSEYRVDTELFYNKNTGYLDEYERRWILDFFPSKSKLIYFNGAFRKIVVTESDVKYAASDLPSSYNFKYRFADESAALLNLIRNADAVPENITIPDIDSPDFHLPPRLSEYPRVTLSEGVIIPVSDPNSDQMLTTTLGAIADYVKEIPSTPGDHTHEISDINGLEDALNNIHSHTHDNKTVIDLLSQENIDVLSKLSLDGDKLKVDTDLYSTGEVSAYGAGDGVEGGGGGATSLDELVDVLLTNPQVGDVLVNNGTHWENKPQSEIIPDLSGYATEGYVNDAFAAVSADKTFVFIQTTPQAVWTISHGLNKFPSVTVVDSAGTEVIGDVSFIDNTTVQITFSAGFSGKAICN